MNDEIIDLVVNELRDDLKIPINTSVNLNNIIENFDIRVRKTNLGNGVLGACKVIGLKKLIVISNGITYFRQERFTMAHEIGHILLHYTSNICWREDFYLWGFTRGKEYEANQFAVKLLMPTKEIRKFLSKEDISFKIIKNISNLYQTSLISTAIRCTKIYNDLAILIYHKNQRISWIINSINCNYNVADKVVDIGTLSSKLNCFNTLVKGFVEPSLWIDSNDLDDNVKCHEESFYFKNLESCLTILKFIED
jgi:Zn-dependent peptidase ImmA (M78 family)